jgi:glycyl-tRNA synthetase
VKAAVLPLSKHEELTPIAKELADKLRQIWNIEYDESAAIGRRYRRQDEIGTPFCITVDFETKDDQAVTIRERDSMEQKRIPLDKVVSYLAENLV